LLSTDWNAHGEGPFISNARQIFGEEGNGTGRRVPRVAFEAWSIDEALDRLARGEALDGVADVLIMDPPWRGLAQHHREEEGGLVRGDVAAKRIRGCAGLRGIIYMSCGPESFMQDADRLTGRDPSAHGEGWGPVFKLVDLKCYDMFPFTDHIETVGIFIRC